MPTSPYEIRFVDDDELAGFVEARANGFGAHANEQAIVDLRRDVQKIRPLAAFEGKDIVGTAGLIPFQLTVSGGTLPMSGVTWVAVKPSHRRRGILTHMMREVLDDAEREDRPLVGLFSSEAPIYGRFGFGVATIRSSLRLLTGGDRPSHRSARGAPGSVRIVRSEDAARIFPAIFEEAGRQRPGWIDRAGVAWEHRLRDRERDRGGASPYFHAVYEEDRPLGYVLYRVVPQPDEPSPVGVLVIHELMSVTREAYASLWRYCLGMDLIQQVDGLNRPAEESLRWMLREPRRLRSSPSDGLWLRILDPRRALEERSYSEEGSLVLDIQDGLCAAASGRFRIDGGPEGARCQSSSRTADLTLDVASLASIYLSGARPSQLAWAGLIQARDQDVLATADAMFATPEIPWCPDEF